jgi:hypothetical protein
MILSPAGNATFGAGSPVAWTNGGGGTTYVVLDVLGNVVTQLILFGGDGSATFPDLSDMGEELPHGSQAQVLLYRDGAAATVDDLAAHGPWFASDTAPYTYAEAAQVQVTTP